MNYLNQTIDSDNVNHYIHVEGKSYAINQDGHLLNFHEWSEETARIMAELDHIKLSNYHWKMFQFIRNYYKQYQVPPSARIIKKEIGDKVKEWGYDGKIFEGAFPLGGCRHACRLAGLPAY